MAQMHPEFTHDHDVFDDPWAVEALLLGDFIGWRPFSDAHVMDIGANVGVWTAFCALHDCRVTAYEADKITFDTLNGMLKKTGLDSRVNTVNAAIWKTTGTMPFAGREVNTRARCRNGCLTVAGAGPYGDGDMTPGLFWGNVISQPENSDLVSTVSFGDALGSEQWDCIKMDIEGVEFRALLGAKNCFTRYRPKLFLATHGREVHGECCQLLRSWHYEFVYTSRTPNDLSDLFAAPRPIA